MLPKHRTAATLAEAVEAALTHAPDHHVVIVVESRQLRWWWVEVLPIGSEALLAQLVDGVQSALAPIDDLTVEVWRQHVDVN